MNNLAAIPQTLTMTSKEIAELTGKEHFNVRRDIVSMLKQLGKDALSFEGMSTDAYGRPLPVYCLPKDLTITLVSGYNVVMRHRIVTRWQELEAKQSTTTLPNFTDPAEAAIAWALQKRQSPLAGALRGSKLVPSVVPSLVPRLLIEIR